jgi:RNA polymerase sigma factor (sigma-70 family)
MTTEPTNPTTNRSTPKTNPTNPGDEFHMAMLNDPFPHNQPNNKETTDNNTDQRYSFPSFSPRERELYIIATWRHLEKIYRWYPPKKYSAHSASELVSFAITKVINNADAFMRVYRTPEHCANAVARTSAQDHRRRELADRGHGARGTRRVEELDAPIAIGDDGDEITLGDTLVAPEGNPEAVIEVMTIAEEIKELLSDATDDELFLIEAIFVDERTQGDIASELGVRRETIVRRYGRLLKRLKEKGFDTSRLEKKRHKPNGNTKNRGKKSRNTTKGVK